MFLFLLFSTLIDFTYVFLRLDLGPSLLDEVFSELEGNYDTLKVINLSAFAI
jgi:hypothetical protein